MSGQSQVSWEDAIPEIRRRLAQRVAAEKLPGLAAGIVVNRQLAWFHTWGVADLATGREITPDTLFRVASITKTLTATAIVRLRDAGQVSLDDPLTRFLPEFASARERSPGASVERVTLRRLLTHHSGLTTEAPGRCWDTGHFPTREELLAALPGLELVIPQDSAFKYSNLAYGLLGEVIQRVTGQPALDYIRESLLVPLEMTSSTFAPDADQRQRCATGYLAGLFDDELRVAPEISLNGIAACGELRSTPKDLARWIGFQFSAANAGPASGEAAILSPESLREMHRPVYLEPDWSVGYGLGWRAVRSGNRVYHGHGGGIYGFASQISFDVAARIGVICLTNRWPHPGLLAAATEILDLLHEQTHEQAGENGTAQSVEAPHRSTPSQFQPLLGEYVAAPGIPVHVEYRRGALRLMPSPLSLYSLHAPAELEPLPEPLTFRVQGGVERGKLSNSWYRRRGWRLHWAGSSITTPVPPAPGNPPFEKNC